MRRLLLLVLLFSAVGASAQDSGPSALDQTSRITVHGGWRLTSNETFYEGYYTLPGNEGLQRAPASPGGPFLGATFGYSATELVEVGIDVFATGERLQLTGTPPITTVTYGAMVGLRFQALLDVLTRNGVVPFVGIQSGPVLAFSTVEGVGVKEAFNQGWAGTVGVNFRLSAHWGIAADYRLVFARGGNPFAGRPGLTSLGSYNAGGSWFSLGVSFYFPPTSIKVPGDR
jgi:opacity protein-like surface antigen